jgi:hypothetical protein
MYLKAFRNLRLTLLKLLRAMTTKQKVGRVIRLPQFQLTFLTFPKSIQKYAAANLQKLNAYLNI